MKLFLSSTWKDRHETRQRLVRAIGEVFGEAFHLVYMERFGADTQPPFDVCLHHVRQSDVFVLLIKWRYGWVPERPENADKGWSMTRREYETACQQGLTILPYFWEGDTIPRQEAQTYVSDLPHLEAFKETVRERQSPARFKDDEELTYLVLGDLYQKVLRRAPAPEVPLPRLSPDVPPSSRFELRGMDWYEEADAPYFHGRDSDVAALRDLLLAHPVVRLTGPSGVGKSSLLRERLKDEDWGVRGAAVEAIGRLGTADDLTLLRELLRVGDAFVRRAAVKAVGELGAADDLPLLRERLKDKIVDVREAAVEAVGRLGTADDLPLLREWLKDENWALRWAAVEAIGRLGMAQDLPLLQERLKDEHWGVCRAAAEAVGRLATLEDLPLLRERLKDADEAVRRAAVEAVCRLDTQENLERLLDEEVATLPWDVLCALDRHLYCPEWWKEPLKAADENG